MSTETKPKLLIIDDAIPQGGIESTIENLKKSFEVTPLETNTFEVLLGQILERNRVGHLDALLMDWRLSEFKNDAGNKAMFDAGGLASELRNQFSAQGDLSNLPICLYSSNEEKINSIRKCYDSHHEFDLYYLKDNIADKYVKVNREIASVIASYQKIKIAKEGKKEILDLLGYDEDWEQNFAIQIQERFSDLSEPAHRISQFIFYEITQKEGPLVSDKMVAARLGVDIHSPGWNELLNEFRSFKYSGPFSELEPQWWWAPIANWWRSLDNADGRGWNFFTAADRLIVLQKEFPGLSLDVAKKLVPQYSDDFSTLCYCDQEPLDITDGLLLPPPKFSWQHQRHVSKKVVLDLKVPKQEVARGEWEYFDEILNANEKRSITLGKD